MSASEEMRITVTTNGPYRVTGSVPLVPRTIVTDEEGFSVEWGEGEPFTTEATYELCRCGATKTAPFCDRDCEDGGFDGTETASREPYLVASRRAGRAEPDPDRRGSVVLVRPVLRLRRPGLEPRGGAGRGVEGSRDQRRETVPVGTADRVGTSDTAALRGGLSAVDRRRPGSDPRVLRSAGGARGHPGDGGRRLRLRTAEPTDPVSVRAFEQQAVLRRDPCRDRLRRRPPSDQWPLIRDLNARGAMVRSPERSDDHGAEGAPTMFASASRTVS